MGRMTAPEQSEARRRLALLIEARANELHLTWNELAEKAGLTKEGLRGVRFGSGRMRRLTKAGLENALLWTSGSVDRILAGGKPTPKAATGEVARPEGGEEALPVPTDAELRASALAPETVDALLAMRRRIGRWLTEGDEATIRRADRVTGALDDEQETG